MYTYYGLAAAGLYKYLWWKNYLTVGQMIQFIFLIIHQGQVFVRSTPCNYPKVFPAAVVCYSLVFFVLFANFYVKAYWRGQRLAKRAKDDDKHAKANHANGNVVANGFAVNGDAKVHKKRA